MLVLGARVQAHPGLGKTAKIQEFPDPARAKRTIAEADWVSTYVICRPARVTVCVTCGILGGMLGSQCHTPCKLSHIVTDNTSDSTLPGNLYKAGNRSLDGPEPSSCFPHTTAISCKKDMQWGVQHPYPLSLH